MTHTVIIYGWKQWFIKVNWTEHHHSKKKQLFEFQVSINEQPIHRVSETMFLGVFVDDNLSWKSHISLLASKLSKSICIIHKSKFFLSTQSLRTLCNSLILPYLYYCNLARGGTYKSNLQRIVILQKRALRIITTLPTMLTLAPSSRNLNSWNFTTFIRFN